MIKKKFLFSLACCFIITILWNMQREVNASSPGDCKSYSLSGKTACFKQLALRNNDVSLCENIETAYYTTESENMEKTQYKYSCISSYAVAVGDTSVCKMIPEEKVHTNCLFEVAIKTMDESLCESFSDDSRQNSCHEGVLRMRIAQAIKNKDSTLCVLSDYPNSCYRNIGFDFTIFLSDFQYAFFWIEFFIYLLFFMCIVLFPVFQSYRRNITLKPTVLFKNPFQYLFMVFLIPAIIWIKSFYKSVQNVVVWGWTNDGYAATVFWVFVPLFCWSIAMAILLQGYKNKSLARLGIILGIIVSLVMIAPFFLRGH